MSGRNNEKDEDYVLPDLKGSSEEYAIRGIENLPEQITGLNNNEVRGEGRQDGGDAEDDDYVLPSLKENKMGRNRTEYGPKCDRINRSENCEFSDDDEYVLPSKKNLNGDKTKESLYVNFQTYEKDSSQNCPSFETGGNVSPSKQCLPGSNFGSNCDVKVLKYKQKGLPETKGTNERTLIRDRAEHEEPKEEDKNFFTSVSSLTHRDMNAASSFINGEIGADNMGFEVDMNNESSLSHVDLRHASNNDICVASDDERCIIEQDKAAKIAADISNLVHEYLVRQQMPSEHEKSISNAESNSVDGNLEKAIIALASQSVMSYLKQHDTEATERGGMEDAGETGIEQSMVSKVLNTHYVNISTGISSVDCVKSSMRRQKQDEVYKNDGVVSGAKVEGDDQSLNGYVDADTSAKMSREHLELTGNEFIPHLQSKQNLQGANDYNGTGSGLKSGGNDGAIHCYVNVDTLANLQGPNSAGATGNEMGYGIKNNTVTGLNYDRKGRKMDHKLMVMAGSTVERPYDYVVIREGRKPENDRTKDSFEALDLAKEARRLSGRTGSPVDSKGGLTHGMEEPHIASPSDYRELEKEEDSNVLLTWARGKDYKPSLPKDEGSYTLVDDLATFVDMKDLEPFVDRSKEDHRQMHSYPEIGEPNSLATRVQLREISSNQNNNTSYNTLSNNNNNSNNNTIDELPHILAQILCCTNTMKIRILVTLTVLLVVGLIVWVTMINT